MGMEGYGDGGGRMGNGDYMDVIHDLIDNRRSITRKYTNTSEGIESFTYSDNLDVGSWIQTHVDQMATLMESGSGCIRRWDDLFDELCEQRDLHEMKEILDTTEMVDGVKVYGVHVNQTVVDGDLSDEEANCAKALIQNHAEVVTKFLTRGRKEMRDNHPVPMECEGV